MRINMLDQTVCIFAHFKEIRFLLCRLHLPAAVRTFSVYKLGFSKERFTGGTIHPFIVTLVNIALVIQLFKYFLDLLLMVIICGTDKLVIRSIHQIPDPLDLCRYIIYELFWCDSCLLCLQFNLLAVLISSGLEKHVISLAPFVARNGICQDNLISIADMRFAGCIGNRSCNIIFWFF